MTCNDFILFSSWRVAFNMLYPFPHRWLTDVLTYPVEFATVGKTKEGKIYHHLWNADEINALLKEHGLAKVDDEPEAGDIK